MAILLLHSFDCIIVVTNDLLNSSFDWRAFMVPILEYVDRTTAPA